MSASTRIKGIAASIGVAVAPARVLGKERQRLSFAHIDDAAVTTELARFEEAVARCRPRGLDDPVP